MPALTIRNISAETMDALHRRAKSAHRSLNGEILMLFEAFVQNAPTSIKAGQKRSANSPSDNVARLRALAGSWKDSRSADDIIADIVRSRTMGREVAL